MEWFSLIFSWFFLFFCALINDWKGFPGSNEVNGNTLRKYNRDVGHSQFSQHNQPMFKKTKEMFLKSTCCDHGLH